MTQPPVRRLDGHAGRRFDPAPRVRAQALAVVTLIKIETRLVPAYNINRKLQAMLGDHDGPRCGGAAQQSRLRRQTF